MNLLADLPEQLLDLQFFWCESTRAWRHPAQTARRFWRKQAWQQACAASVWIIGFEEGEGVATATGQRSGESGAPLRLPPPRQEGAEPA